MDKIVLDTHAAMAFVCDEKGADKVLKTLSAVLEKGGTVYMTAVNYGEFFYAIAKKLGKQAALKARHNLDLIPVEVVDADKGMALIAAGIKAEKKMSFADCFSAALARMIEAPLLTGDPEFRQVEKEVKLIWI